MPYQCHTSAIPSATGSQQNRIEKPTGWYHLNHILRVAACDKIISPSPICSSWRLHIDTCLESRLKYWISFALGYIESGRLTVELESRRAKGLRVTACSFLGSRHRACCFWGPLICQRHPLLPVRSPNIRTAHYVNQTNSSFTNVNFSDEGTDFHVQYTSSKPYLEIFSSHSGFYS